MLGSKGLKIYSIHTFLILILMERCTVVNNPRSLEELKDYIKIVRAALNTNIFLTYLKHVDKNGKKVMFFVLPCCFIFKQTCLEKGWKT